MAVTQWRLMFMGREVSLEAARPKHIESSFAETIPIEKASVSDWA
ncbi:MAG TPA: hypothetical protein VI072_07040 [Polyangiaceae bacterium]